VTRRWLPPALLTLFAAAFGWRALAGGLLVFDDHPGQVYRVAHAIALGPAPWRFNPGWWTGYAELQYYPPGFAWLGALLHLAAGGVLAVGSVYQILLWLAWLLPGATTYLLLRRALGDPWLALPGAFVALTISAGCRSGVEEGLRWGQTAARLGFGVLPLLAWSLLPWAAGAPRWPRSGAAGLVAAVVLLHPAHAPTAAILVLLAAWQGAPRGRRLGEAAMVLAAGAGLAAIWLLPLLVHLPMALPLAWADTSPAGLLWRLASQPILVALSGLGVVAWWRRARLPASAVRLLGVAPMMAVVVFLDALVVQPAGLAWLPADRVMDGLVLGLVLAGAAGFAALAASRARPDLAAGLALAVAVALAWGPGEPGLTLWPRGREWPKEHEVVRGLRLDALWEAIRQAPPGRVLFVRSAVPLDWRPEWWRPHTHVIALTPLRTGRPIVGGTFTHPAPVAGLVYTGSAEPGPLTVLAEQHDGQSLFGRPLEALDAEAFNRHARALGIGLVVALEDDVGRARFLSDNPALGPASRVGPFRLFSTVDGVTAPVPAGRQRWRLSVSGAPPGWIPLPIAYSPLWTARVAGTPVSTRRDERGLLEVALSAPAPEVELEHRAGVAEWAGAGFSLLALGAVASWGIRSRRA
jgi:hypothetical protein